MRESKIESAFKKYAENHGFLCLKFTSPNAAGVPDRILIGNGQVVFVELKAPGRKPRPLQVAQIEKIRARDVRVEVIDNIDDAKALVDEIASIQGR